MSMMARSIGDRTICLSSNGIFTATSLDHGVAPPSIRVQLMRAHATANVFFNGANKERCTFL
ncbi:hypothetical protein EHI42_04930 [Rhizobium hidalgonense]|nr:hypothetical protein EHI42_04930 [Rhizobium hidalgonense]